jgi:uncharacterized protein YodC (DUF2158 family)
VFAVGDVVRMIGASVNMTVANVDDDFSVYCRWFNARGELQGAIFRKDLVRLVVTEPWSNPVPEFPKS